MPWLGTGTVQKASKDKDISFYDLKKPNFMAWRKNSSYKLSNTLYLWNPRDGVREFSLNEMMVTFWMFAIKQIKII